MDGGIISGLFDIGSSIIQANAQKAAASNAENAQQALQQQAFQQQATYIQQQEAAQRGALSGIASQGNPYFNAAQSLPKPTFAAGGQFGPAAPTGANLNPMAAGAFSNMATPQAPPAQAPAAFGAAAGSPSALMPGAVQRPPMAQGAAQVYQPGMRRTM
jgi:hypothetical protein